MSLLKKARILLFLISASVLNFEITSTRISSVIFVNSYAFVILSLAIMGMALGSIYFFYSQKKEESETMSFRPFLLHLLSGMVLVIAVTKVTFITTPLLFFAYLLPPFFFAGWFYSSVFKFFPDKSFQLYAADLVGASLGAFLPLLFLEALGPLKGILIVSLVIAFIWGVFHYIDIRKWLAIALLPVMALAVWGIWILPTSYLGSVPIGDFEEKDIYHVYDDQGISSDIIESRWSVFGRSDLVEHSNQNMVKHLFVDGAAGSQMYRFNGDVSNLDPILSTMLMGYTNFLPFLVLDQDQRSSMLVIGPGGGKEVLAGLISGIGSITGVELNKDFIDIVKDEAAYNGGIYTSFPNVQILQMEGRQFVRETTRKYDIMVMALPSTQQLQSIESYALNENYLLTVESIIDYLDVLTPEGELILTVHNNWELRRLIACVIEAYKAFGVSEDEVLTRLMVLDRDYAPTLVVRKNSFSQQEVEQIWGLHSRLPDMVPPVTYLPHSWSIVENTPVNSFIAALSKPGENLKQVLSRQRYNIKPVYDDNPYFYNLNNGAPAAFNRLLIGLLIAGFMMIALPFFRSNKEQQSSATIDTSFFVIAFSGIGMGFMMMEVSLFQKMVLYLGSPTISLSILLSAMLIGMGVGSLLSNKLFKGDMWTRLLRVFVAILVIGTMAIVLYPIILNKVLDLDIIVRSVLSFLLILPLGFVLGIPFPTLIALLYRNGSQFHIPWMYANNGVMSVIASVFTIILSMIFGFIYAFSFGLICYGVVLIAIVRWRNSIKAVDK